MPSGFLEKNLSIISLRFPFLAEKVKALDASKVGIAKAADGGVCYAVMNEQNEWIPVSDYQNPVKAAQLSLDKMQHRLSGGLCPAVIVGLYPGYILESVFRHFQSRLNYNEPFRHIYIVIDSTYCLLGWMKAADRTAILNQPEVSFHWHEKVNEIANLCEKDLQRSHLFIPFSVLPDDRLNKMIAPLAELYLRRQKEERIWHKENEEYYDDLTDEKLARIISGKAGRKPRLLMPTHMSSTVVQYSTRDTCKAFEQMGWDTLILKMERDLSPWLMSKVIHEFKPDVFIFINHLRTEHKNVVMYPEDMMFITWIQDTMPHLNNKEMADSWNKFALGVHSKTGEPRKRDLLIGYIDVIQPFGYAEERMMQLGMIVNPDIFKPRDLTVEQLEKYGCDICFASNKGKTTEDVLENELYPYLSKFGIPMKTAFEIHDLLWKVYREEKTITTYSALEELICSGIPAFKGIYSRLDEDAKANIIEKIFWSLNDTIYRHVILEWIDETGSVKLNIYGKNWELHPKFWKYAKGIVEHGEELSIAYQAAKCCLHLNSREGEHQRIMEIAASGATPITRINVNHGNEMPDELKHLLNWLSRQMKSLQGNDSKEPVTDDLLSIRQHGMLSDWIFNHASRVASGIIKNSGEKADYRLIATEVNKSIVANIIAWNPRFFNIESINFSDKKSLCCAVELLPGRIKDAPSPEKAFSDGLSVVQSVKASILKVLNAKDIINPTYMLSSVLLNITEFSTLIAHAAPIGKVLNCFRKIEYPGNAIKMALIQYFISSPDASKDNEMTEAVHHVLNGMDFFELDVSGIPAFIVCMAAFGDIDRAISVLNSKKIDEAFPGFDAIALALQCALSLICKCDRTSAEKIIKHIDPERINRQEHIDTLCLLYIRLYKFDEAHKMFRLAEKKSLNGGLFHFYKGIYHYCRWELDEMEKCIAQESKRSNGQPDTLLEVLFTNRLGRHSETLTVLDKLCNSSLWTDLKLASMFVKANILRSTLDFEGAVKCYSSAESMPRSGLWSWMTLFEHAMTMLFTGNEEQALLLAREGTLLTFQSFSSCYNPCAFLYKFILHRHADSNNGTCFSAGSLNEALSWPLACVDYRAWMLLFVAAELDAKEDADGAREIIYRLISDPLITEPGRRKNLNALFSKVQSFRNPQFIDALSDAMWPYHSADSYERKILKKIML